MGQILQTRTSLNDLDAIWERIAEENPRRASQYIKKIEAKLKILSDNPLMGKRRWDLADTLRQFPVGSHLILYMPIEDGIMVVRVRHQREDISRFF